MLAAAGITDASATGGSADGMDDGRCPSRQARTLFGCLLVQGDLATARTMLLEILERLLWRRASCRAVGLPLLHTVAAIWPDILRSPTATATPDDLDACTWHTLVPAVLEHVGRQMYGAAEAAGTQGPTAQQVRRRVRGVFRRIEKVLTQPGLGETGAMTASGTSRW